ncbi:hypothetical protein [Azospira inquinata]|uniref:Integrase n=1 Tax=Azospira inquinata TaxID=2785627 RepID=A0A975SQE7_9RHOO|nr:hypothetical protein [Azospira inquinata]QWT47065.1 hypothetical protein J8L76_04975 [Azospira inquinata]QWT50306.1 hypothetical protein Azoinq_06895 [Azospira inquinata]
MSVMLGACFEKKGVCAPDPWLDSYGISLPLDHVVTRDKNGGPISRLGDFKWDLTAYTAHGEKCILHFDYWAGSSRKEINKSQCTDSRIGRMRELQFLMCKRLYPADGSTSSPRSLMRNLLVIRKVALFAEQHDRSLQEIFEQPEWLDACISKMPDFQCNHFMAWLNFLNKLNPITELGFQVAKPLRIRDLSNRGRRYREKMKQHAALPTRIYSLLITNLSTELDDIETHKERLLDLLRDAIQVSTKAKIAGWRSYETPIRSLGSRLITKHDLADYFNKRGYVHSMHSISAFINEIFHVCALQIHTFSGMRHNEGRTLPFYCMESEKRNGRSHALFVGATTKFNGGRRTRTKWVTTDKEGFRAARLTQEFATVIYEYMGITPSDDEATKDRYPLFISTEYLPWGIHRSGDTERFHQLKARSYKALSARLLPTISAADIDELEDIDPFRAWANEEEFTIGNRWKLTKHQLRRSLALYARASGCVRLSSLRRQLQHISNDMSAYYGNGCAFAKDFLADDSENFREHIALEWQETEAEAAVLAMVWDVLKSNEPLYGGAGNFHDQQRRNGSLMTRKQIEKAVKAGTLGYTPHPLGACVKPGPCEKRMGLNFIDIACANDNCKNLVGKHSKIIQVIKAKCGMLERIDKTTLTYKAEKEELDELVKIEARWRPQNGLATPLREAENG